MGIVEGQWEHKAEWTYHPDNGLNVFVTLRPKPLSIAWFVDDRSGPAAATLRSFLVPCALSERILLSGWLLAGFNGLACVHVGGM